MCCVYFNFDSAVAAKRIPITLQEPVSFWTKPKGKKLSYLRLRFSNTIYYYNAGMVVGGEEGGAGTMTNYYSTWNRSDPPPRVRATAEWSYYPRVFSRLTSPVKTYFFAQRFPRRKFQILEERLSRRWR